jgi:competence protein ComEC
MLVNLGDADKNQELQALKQNPFLRHARPLLLKVSHHGSRFSSSSQFLEKIRPARAWISCGRKNRFGHPTREVLERVYQWNSGLPFRVERTDRDGDLIYASFEPFERLMRHLRPTQKNDVKESTRNGRNGKLESR